MLESVEFVRCRRKDFDILIWAAPNSERNEKFFDKSNDFDKTAQNPTGRMNQRLVLTGNDIQRRWWSFDASSIFFGEVFSSKAFFAANGAEFGFCRTNYCIRENWRRSNTNETSTLEFLESRRKGNSKFVKLLRLAEKNSWKRYALIRIGTEMMIRTVTRDVFTLLWYFCCSMESLFELNKHNFDVSLQFTVASNLQEKSTQKKGSRFRNLNWNICLHFYIRKAKWSLNWADFLSREQLSLTL